MLVAFQCPQPDLLGEIAALCDRYRGNLSRYDISSDAIGSAHESLIFIKEHLLLRYRKAMPIKEFDNINGEGTLYCAIGAPRNIALYADLPSKLRPKGPNIAKFDLRLRGRAKCGIGHNALIGMDPSEIILRNVRFVEFDRRRFEREQFRKVTKEERDDPAQAKARINNMKRHSQFDFVQRAHDHDPDWRLPTNNGLVRLASRLAWGAQRRSTGKKDMSNEINMVG